MRRKLLGLLLMVLVFAVAGPVLAAPQQQEGGVHFGAYTLGLGEEISGDLVVFGGPVLLDDDSLFDGDLTVFGPMSMEGDALLDGQLVVMGSADVAGTVEGDIFCAGTLTLRDGAYIGGNVATAGTIRQEQDAVVSGDLMPMSEDDWSFPWVPTPGVQGWQPTIQTNTTPRWVTFLQRVVRGVAGVLIMALLALVLSSLWPRQLNRVGRAIEEAPLASFGVGLLTLILSVLIAALLAITICLSPFAIVGLIVVGLGLLLGWVALGTVLGRRILDGLNATSSLSPSGVAVVGTALVTLLLALARVFGVIHTLLVFLLVPPAAGAVLLTRFGTIPYATRGTGTLGDATAIAPQAPSPKVATIVPSTPDPDGVPSVTDAEPDSREEET